MCFLCNKVATFSFLDKIFGAHIPLLAEEGSPRHQKMDPFRFVADGVVSSARLRRPAELTTAFVASRHFLDGAATFEASPYRARAPRPPLRGGEYDAFKLRPNGNSVGIWLRRSRAVPFVVGSRLFDGGRLNATARHGLTVTRAA